MWNTCSPILCLSLLFCLSLEASLQVILQDTWKPTWSPFPFDHLLHSSLVPSLHSQLGQKTLFIVSSDRVWLVSQPWHLERFCIIGLEDWLLMIVSVDTLSWGECLLSIYVQRQREGRKEGKIGRSYYYISLYTCMKMSKNKGKIRCIKPSWSSNR